MPNDYVSQFKGHNNTLYDIRDDNTIYVGQASGAVAHCPDAIDNINFREIIANITPVQSGTGDPSPSNQRPITGWSAVNVARTGVNVWDEQWEEGTINDTTGIPSTSTTQIRSKNYCVCKGDTNYYAYVGSNQSIRVFWYDSTQTFISQTVNIKNTVITSPNNAKYFKIRSTNAYGNTYLNDISISYPATDTAYHAYTGQTATINLGGTYYGGTLNVGTGVLTVDRAIVDLSTFTLGTLGDIYIWYKAFDNIVVPASNSEIGQVISEYYAPIRYNGVSSTANTIAIRTNAYMYVNTGGNTTPQGNAVYNLATPFTVQLTPAQITQLLGENNVWADSGDINVEYYRNTSVVQAIRDLASIDHLGFWRDDNGCLCQG